MFKPKPLRYSKIMAGKAFDAFASIARSGLTQALALMKKPALALIVSAVAYLGYLAILLALDFTPVVAGRLAISALLLFFVLRGSRIAGNILAVLCGLGALVLLVAAVATFPANPMGAILFTVIMGLLAVFAGYLFFSKSIRVFQGKALPAAPV